MYHRLHCLGSRQQIIGNDVNVDRCQCKLGLARQYQLQLSGRLLQGCKRSIDVFFIERIQRNPGLFQRSFCLGNDLFAFLFRPVRRFIIYLGLYRLGGRRFFLWFGRQ
jgi:hypothetical protein